jgi:hypothetical protein
MLIISSWSEQFRSDIGFNGVSQIWDDRLSWYFWLTDAPGVYQLEMMNTEEDSGIHTAPYNATFRIKCYPYPQRPEFQSFSFFEKELIQSHLFDETNTPAFEHQSHIPEDLFVVATVDMTMDPEGPAATFSFESMASLRTRYAGGSRQAFPLLELEYAFDDQEVDRDVPGFSIGYRLFDCLLCLYANTHKQTPFAIRCWKTPGYEVSIKNGCVDARITSEISGFKLWARYLGQGFDHFPEGVSEKTGSSEESESILYDRHFSCGHFHENENEKILPMKLNPMWWSLAHRHYESELSSTCGCH